MTFDAPPVTYLPEDFKMDTEEQQVTGTGSAPDVADQSQLLNPAELSQSAVDDLPISPEWKQMIRKGEAPGRDYPSRSEMVFAVVIHLLSARVDPAIVLAILLEPNLRIGDHIRDHSYPMGYARRQVSRAMAYLDSRGGEWPRLTDKGAPIQSHPANIRHAFERLGMTAHRNLFSSVDEYDGQGLEGRDLNDVADILCSKLRRKFEFVASAASIRRELTAIAQENQYHPIKEYFGGLPAWDGVERLDRWLIDYCGAEDTELHRFFARLTLVGAVRRILRPGCKFDTMLVLEGGQGINKSRLLRLLARRDEWFCESLSLRSDDKTKAELLSGAWIVECQELDGLGKITGQELKRFLSASTDMFRRAYDRNARHYPRHCIIIGTTNESDYLRDLTGNRRIWPVRVGRIDIEGMSQVIDQLWAEAVFRESEGIDITLPERLWAVAEEAQKRRIALDPYEDTLRSAFGGRTGKVSLDTVKGLLGISLSRMTAQDTRRIRAIMLEIGWEYSAYRLRGSRSGDDRTPQRGFACGSAQERKVEHVLLALVDGQQSLGIIHYDGPKGQNEDEIF